MADAPDAGQDQAGEGKMGVLQPVGRRPGGAEQVISHAEKRTQAGIDQTEIPIQEPKPQHGQAHQGHEGGKKKNRPEKTASGNFGVKQEREKKR